MNYSAIIISLFYIILFSCEENNEKKLTDREATCNQSDEYDYLNNYAADQICTSDTCTEYLSLWKELFFEKNHISEDFYEDHVELARAGMNSWKKGVSFRVCYRVKIDWAIAYNCDSFIIKINENNNYFASLNLPRDIYLSKDQIEIAIENRAFSSSLNTISNSEDLQFISMNDALASLIIAANINTLCSKRIFINKETGHLTLEAYAQYMDEYNSCIQGSIDLINGNTTVRDIPCWINYNKAR